MPHEPLYIFLHVPKCAGTTLRDTVTLKFNAQRLLLLYAGHKSMQLAADSDSDTGFQMVDAYLESLPTERKEKISVIFGHRVYYGIHNHFPGREPRYLTFLRRPDSRTASVYRFKISTLRKLQLEPRVRYGFTKPAARIAMLEREMLRDGNTIDLAAWIASRRDNAMSRYLFSRRFFDKEQFSDIDRDAILKGLGKFHFVGVVEDARDVLRFHHLLGLRYFLRPRNVAAGSAPLITADVQAMILEKDELDACLYSAAVEAGENFRSRHGDIDPTAFRFKAIRFCVGEFLFLLHRVVSYLKRRLQAHVFIRRWFRPTIP